MVGVGFVQKTSRLSLPAFNSFLESGQHWRCARGSVARKTDSFNQWLCCSLACIVLSRQFWHPHAYRLGRWGGVHACVSHFAVLSIAYGFWHGPAIVDTWCTRRWWDRISLKKDPPFHPISLILLAGCCRSFHGTHWMEFLLFYVEHIIDSINIPARTSKSCFSGGRATYTK